MKKAGRTQIQNQENKRTNFKFFRFPLPFFFLNQKNFFFEKYQIQVSVIKDSKKKIKMRDFDKR